MSRRGRDKYAEVGPAMRRALRRANAVSMADGERRVFNAALELTAGAGRLWDDVYVPDVRRLTGFPEAEDTWVHERTVRRYLKRLADRGIFGWEPKRGTDASGRGFPSRLTLPKAEQSGRPSGSVSSSGSEEGKPGVRPIVRVEQPPPREEDLEQERFLGASRACANGGEPDETEMDRLWDESASPSKGAYWEPGS